HTGTPAHRHTGTPAHRHTGTPAHRHTGTPAHRHTGWSCLPVGLPRQPLAGTVHATIHADECQRLPDS
ncbi:hypothetical protein ABT099_08610, partial [Streptomyces prasinus]